MCNGGVLLSLVLRGRMSSSSMSTSASRPPESSSAHAASCHWLTCMRHLHVAVVQHGRKSRHTHACIRLRSITTPRMPAVISARSPTHQFGSENLLPLQHTMHPAPCCVLAMQSAQGCTPHILPDRCSSQNPAPQALAMLGSQVYIPTPLPLSCPSQNLHPCRKEQARGAARTSRTATA